MTLYYDLLDTIKNQLSSDDFVNTVTTGDLFDVDIAKQTIFPLSHIMVNNATDQGRVMKFNISIICMDIVDTVTVETTDIFRDNDNEHDVLNTQLAVIMRALKVLRLNDQEFQIDGDISAEPFTDRFDNKLAGWVATFDVLMPNTMTKC